MLATAVLIAAMELNCFLLPNHFINGGIPGVSIVNRIDAKAFVVTVPVLDAKGGVVKQRTAY